jgi:osmotically-inducible protein OsmY
MRLATVLCTGLLFGLLLGCSRADQERAQAKAEQAKGEARKLGTEAEVKAKELNQKIGQRLDSGTGSSESPDEKIQHAETVARREGQVAGRKLDRAGIEARVKAKLANNVGLATVSGVSVSAADGVVTLSGTVSSDDQKREAERAAASVDGVTKVVNQLTVQP